MMERKPKPDYATEDTRSSTGALGRWTVCNSTALIPLGGESIVDYLPVATNSVIYRDVTPPAPIGYECYHCGRIWKDWIGFCESCGGIRTR